MLLGCSADSVELLTRFKTQFKLNHALLSDPEFHVIEAYGARRMKYFLGKSFLGIVRMSYWIGEKGEVRKIWEKASAKGHAEEVLEAVRNNPARS